MLKNDSPACISLRIMSVATWSAISSPSSMTFLALLRFMVWVKCVAHRQLPGVYPLLPSMRSKVDPDGRGPMSFKKFMNPSGDPHHRLEIFTPLYSGFDLHRWCMAFHELYSGVPLARCVRPLCSHPQFRDCPSRNDDASTALSVPQSQRHSHRVLLWSVWSVLSSGFLPITTHFPKRIPETSIKRPIWNLQIWL